MSSPFAVFRRNQKVLTVILTCLAMFAFIILDSVSKMDSSAIMPIVFGLVGAALAWLWGSQNERGVSYRMIGFGAIAGAAAGAMIISQAINKGGVTTALGRLSDRDLFEMKQQRDTANQFIAGAFRERKENAYAFLMDRYLFGGTSTREVVTKRLLAHEADQLGIEISDDYITNYIKEVSDNSINRESLTKLRSQMGLGESELYDVLRLELRAQVAYRVLNPALVHMPDQYWNDFQKLNVRHSIDAVAIPVEPFAKRLDRPSDAELAAVFDAFKSVYPMGENPGFVQPDRLKLAWFESDYETAEKLVGEIPDSELKTRYEERKESIYKIETLPDLGSGFDDGGLKFGEPPPPAKSPAPATGKPADELPKKDASESDSKGTPGSDAPTDAPKDADSPKDTDAKTPATPKVDSPAPAPTSAKSEKTAPTPGDPKECGDDSAEDSGSQASEDAPEKSVEAKPVDGEKNTEKDAEKKTSSSDPKSTPADDPKSPPASKEPVPEKPVSKDAAAEGATVEKTSTDKVATSPDAASKEAAPVNGDKPESEVKYRPFEEVRDEIRDLMLREKTEERIRTQIAAAITTVKDWRFTLKEAAPEITNEDLAAQIADKAKEYATQKGLKFVSIDTFLSQQELIDHKDHQIGTAREPFDVSTIMTQTESQTVAARLFTGATSLFIPEEAEGQFDDTRYAFWTTGELEQHEPTFEEPGIREKVEEAVRLQKARPEAEARAKKLAEEVTAKFAAKSIISFTEGIADQSVLGSEKAAAAKPNADKEAASESDPAETNDTKKGANGEVAPKDDKDSSEAAAGESKPAEEESDDEPLSVISSPPFTWLRQSSQGMQANPFAQPTVEFGIIPGIDGVDDNFMQTVSDTPVGGVVVVPNFTKQIYYVVHVKARNPSGVDDPSIGPVRQQFITENAPMSPIYGRLANSQASAIHQKWLVEFLSKHDVDIAELDSI